MKTSAWAKFALGTVVALLATLGYAYAQIKGIILTTDRKPAEGAVVSLLQRADSSLAKSEIAGPDGTFSFLKPRPGAYLISVSMIGSRNFSSQPIDVSETAGATDLGTITLEPADANLQEVKVLAQKNFVEYATDRTVVNALISNVGTNVLEVLEKSPGVMVDQSGNISLKGQSGVLVMIDNRPTYLSATALAAYLRSLPSNSVEKIELITHPPARYDAAGSAGIINIRTKKTKVRGLNGSVALAPARSRYLGPGIHGRLPAHKGSTAREQHYPQCLGGGRFADPSR